MAYLLAIGSIAAPLRHEDAPNAMLAPSELSVLIAAEPQPELRTSAALSSSSVAQHLPAYSPTPAEISILFVAPILLIVLMLSYRWYSSLLRANLVDSEKPAVESPSHEANRPDANDASLRHIAIGAAERLACAQGLVADSGAGASKAWRSEGTTYWRPFEHLVLVVERAALAKPDLVAIRSLNGVEVSYRALFASACSVANALLDAGMAASDLVGLMIPRSPEAIAALLGTVIGGGAYVPLDPTYPPRKLSDLIASARIHFVTVRPGSDTAAWLQDEWPEIALFDAPILGEEAARANVATSDPLQRAGLRNDETSTDRLMFVLFTSGSTGKPKAVPGFERPILEGARFFSDIFPYETDEVVIHHITYSWADHKADVWHPLLSGKTLLLVSSTEELVNLSLTPPENVLTLWAVPSLLNAILTLLERNHKDSSLTLSDCPFLRLVFATGEALPELTIRRYRALVPHGTIVSLYGLTEAQGETSIAIYGPSRKLTGHVSMGSPRSS